MNSASMHLVWIVCISSLSMDLVESYAVPFTCYVTRHPETQTEIYIGTMETFKCTISRRNAIPEDIDCFYGANDCNYLGTENLPDKYSSKRTSKNTTLIIRNETNNLNVSCYNPHSNDTRTHLEIPYGCHTTKSYLVKSYAVPFNCSVTRHPETQTEIYIGTMETFKCTISRQNAIPEDIDCFYGANDCKYLGTENLPDKYSSKRTSKNTTLIIRNETNNLNVSCYNPHSNDTRTHLEIPYGCHTTKSFCKTPPDNSSQHWNVINSSAKSELPYQESVKLMCETGYRLNNGTTTNNENINQTISCLENGTWSFALDCTKKVCTTPPDNSSQHWNAINSSAKSELSYQEIVKLMCEPGYRLNNGTSTNNENINQTISCLENGTWSFALDCIKKDADNSATTGDIAGIIIGCIVGVIVLVVVIGVMVWKRRKICLFFEGVRKSSNPGQDNEEKTNDKEENESTPFLQTTNLDHVNANDVHELKSNDHEEIVELDRQPPDKEQRNADSAHEAMNIANGTKDSSNAANPGRGNVTDSAHGANDSSNAANPRRANVVDSANGANEHDALPSFVDDANDEITPEVVHNTNGTKDSSNAANPRRTNVVDSANRAHGSKEKMKKKNVSVNKKPSHGEVGGRTVSTTHYQDTKVDGASSVPETATDTTAEDVNSTDAISISSDWFEELSISDAEKAEFETIMERCGYNALIQKLETWNSDWKQPTIDIAVAGAAGAGKSTLINSLRGLKEGDNGAAETGCTETTTKVTCYPHPQNPNLKILDLPGVGTPNFPRDTYLETVDFKSYDFLLLVSSSRFTETDLWLAKHIVESTPNINLFFIRTHIDNDFENSKLERRQDLTERDRTKIAKKIKKNCSECLENAEIRSAKVFLINSHRTDHFDFKKLQMSFVDTVSDIKREAMILSLTINSEEILEKKVDVLRKQIPDAARHETGEKPTLRNLREISCLFANQLGISTSSLQIIATNFKRDVSELKKMVNMKIPAILASEKNFEKYCTIYGIGKIQFEHVLECMLKMCKDESQKLQTTIALWSHEDTK